MTQNTIESVDKLPHKCWIFWGEFVECVEIYEFATNVELEAFRYGVNEGEGWQGYFSAETVDEAREAIDELKTNDKYCLTDKDLTDVGLGELT